ncbi:DUF6042 family protein [Plantactinospora sp. WMMC1484]|uniref:DUF6042 family protein n=1 Tax=Plantactinospora sp. WMMC1484 TaxID=3404122 RepID=UPI003BF4F4CC
MTPRWQRAALTPSWIRWLPCAFAHLTVVPARPRFRRSAWTTMVPWEGSAWCDPGSVDEWVERARRRRAGRDAEDVELHAREHYAWMVRVRATRIELFAEMCRRRGIPVPHTVGELLLCLAEFGLFDIAADTGDGDPWITPRLDRDPLEVLPLSAQERELETRAQRDDQAVLVAIAIRRLAQRTRRRWRRRLVSTSLTRLAGAAGVTEEQARRSLTDLGQIAELGVDTGRGDERLRLSVPWPDFRLRFPFTELPAPEHAI